MRVLLILLVAMAVAATTTMAGRGRWKKERGSRGCRRAAGQGVTEDGPGSRYVWTLSGLNDDDLQVTFMEGAFAPEGSTTVFKYPRDRGQRDLGVFPAKLFYDFSNPDAPVAVIRQGRRGRGQCIVVNNPDVQTYEDVIALLEARNGTNGNLPEEEEEVKLLATRVEDGSQFSEAVRQICAQDQCGRVIQPVYYVTDVAPESDDDDDDDQLAVESETNVGDDNAAQLFEPSFMMLATRVTITGLPSHHHSRMERRKQRGRGGMRHQHGHSESAGMEPSRRRGHGHGRRHHGRGGDDDDDDDDDDSTSDDVTSQLTPRQQRRQDRRQGRREDRIAERLQRRQERRGFPTVSVGV